MQINKTYPESSTRWQSDSPSVKAMRTIKPIAALLSAISLSGGIASFFNLGFTSIIGIALIIAFAVFAWHFDGMAVTSGESAVREGILAWKGEISIDLLFWLNMALSILLCGAMVFGSFKMSQNGITYLVLEVRKVKEIRTQVDTALTDAVQMAGNQNAGMLEAEKSAYEARVNAVNTKYSGEIEALEAEITRREAQRNDSNKDYITNRISRIRKQIGETKSRQGEELAKLSEDFAARQKEILNSDSDLQEIALNEAKQASGRAKKLQDEKDENDKMLSGLVSSIFAWSVVLMLFIGLRLSMLETRNGILPDPVLSNADISGQTVVIRFVMAVPNFLLSCLTWCSEQLYIYSPKKPVPVVDNDIIDFNASQVQVQAQRKVEGVSRKQILKAVKKSEKTNKPEDRLTAWDMITMYLQTNEAEEVQGFYDKCVSFVQGNGPNPFHARIPIGFHTNGARNASYNELRYPARDAHGLPVNSSEGRYMQKGEKACENCSKIFMPKVTFQKYCCDECRFEFNRNKGGHSTKYEHGYKHRPSKD